MENTVISHLYYVWLCSIIRPYTWIWSSGFKYDLKETFICYEIYFWEWRRLLSFYLSEILKVLWQTSFFFFLLVYFFITVSVSIINFFYIIYLSTFFNWNFLCQGWWMNWFLEAEMTKWQSTSFYDWGRGWKKPKIVCFSLWLNR